MAIVAKSITIPTNGNFAIAKGIQLNKVVAKGVTVWEKVVKRYVWDGATLYPGVTLVGLDNYGGRLRSWVRSQADDEEDADTAPPEEASPSIRGIDLTGFSKMTVTIYLSISNTWNGQAYINFGIDSANQRFYTVSQNTDYCEITHTGTLDVSGYSGVHNLAFYQYASSMSDYWGNASTASIGVMQVLLE